MLRYGDVSFLFPKGQAQNFPQTSLACFVFLSWPGICSPFRLTLLSLRAFLGREEGRKERQYFPSGKSKLCQRSGLIWLQAQNNCKQDRLAPAACSHLPVLTRGDSDCSVSASKPYCTAPGLPVQTEYTVFLE